MNLRNRLVFVGSVLIAGCGTNVEVGGPPLPEPVAGAQLALGDEHSCAVTQGKVHCWGKNRNGELGDGTTVERHTPVLVPGLEGVLQIAAGAAFDIDEGTRGSHTCARLTDGTVTCWGPNVDGQKDEGTVESRHLSPTPVDGLTDVVQLAVGAWHTCAVRGDGTVRCWGDNVFGQLGSGLDLPRSSTPVQVEGLTDVVEVAAGEQSTCARHAGGTVSCWGGDFAGQLGDGASATRATPEVIPGLTGVAQIASAWDTVCARLDDGTVRCWGDNESGQLGDPSNADHGTPLLVAVQGAQQISAGGLLSCARLGTAGSCWGRDLAGPYDDAPPQVVMGLTGIAEIAVSPANHACAALTDGRVECWGENESGELGDGTTTRRAAPTPVLF